MPISTLRAWEAAQEADEQLAAEQERREELERGYRRLEAHATMLETQVSELRELNERQERHDMIFTAIVVGICLLLLLFANYGCKPAEAEESEAASVPPVIVDASDQKAQERRSHEVEQVEAGKLDSDGNPIDGEKAIVTRLREFAQQRRDEAAAIAAEAQQGDVSDGVYVEDEYPYQNEYIGPVRSYDDRGTGFASSGVINNENGKFTWYSQRDMPGGGLTELNENGRTVNDQGFVVDGDGYIAVALPDQEVGNYEKGDVVDTPFGPGKVYDRNKGGTSWDIYTDY